MSHRLGRHRPGAGEAVGSRLPRLGRGGAFRSGRGLQARHATRTTLLLTALELLDAGFEALQGGLLLCQGGGLRAH
jgi:hypothetical protein